MKVLNTLNIDTALGAVSFVFVASIIKSVEVELAIYGALVASVLFIYNLDHLVDAFKLKDALSSYRHYFYQKYFKPLLIWQGLLFITIIWLLFQLPLKVVAAGVIMTIFMGIYFLFVFIRSTKNYVLREVVVALGYTFAIIIVPFANYPLSFEMEFIGFSTILFLTALTNLWVFATYEIEMDKIQDHHSIARKVNTTKMTRLIKIIIGLDLVLIVLLYVHWSVTISFLVVELTYFILLERQHNFRKNDAYRSIGEAILILPGLLLFVLNAI